MFMGSLFKGWTACWDHQRFFDRCSRWFKAINQAILNLIQVRSALWHRLAILEWKLFVKITIFRYWLQHVKAAKLRHFIYWSTSSSCAFLSENHITCIQYAAYNIQHTIFSIPYAPYVIVYTDLLDRRALERRSFSCRRLRLLGLGTLTPHIDVLLELTLYFLMMGSFYLKYLSKK